MYVLGRRISGEDREKQLREQERRQPPAEASLLQEWLRLMEADGPWKVNFADLCGLSTRIPDLHLRLDYHIHNCEFCTLAKHDPVSRLDCERNKRAVNWVLLRRGKGFAGQCHLGLTDIVEPVCIGRRVLGSFFVGSVVVRGSADLARKRIARYCRRRGMDSQPLLKAFSRVPVVSSAELQTMRERARLTARLAGRLMEAWGFPLGNERPGLAGALWEANPRLPAALQQAMQHAQKHFHEPLSLGALAASLGLSSDYMGNLFRKHLDCTFGDYLAHVRIHHACRLLETRQYSAAEIAYRTGFADQAHFGKVFKRIIGQTPKGYAAQDRA